MPGLGGMVGRKGSLRPGLRGFREVSGAVALLDTHHSKLIAQLLVSSSSLISAHFFFAFLPLLRLSFCSTLHLPPGIAQHLG